MLCFDVQINGKKICTAGIGDYGVLTAVTSLVRSRRKDSSVIEDTAQLKLDIGGTVSLSECVDENVSWQSGNLQVGDEITIKITEGMQSDQPVERSISDPVVELEKTRAHYEWLISEFEREIEDRRGHA